MSVLIVTTIQAPIQKTRNVQENCGIMLVAVVAIGMIRGAMG